MDELNHCLLPMVVTKRFELSELFLQAMTIEREFNCMEFDELIALKLTNYERGRHEK